MIYLRLDGRIGNQLFMYSFAKNISKQRGNELIVIDDKEAIKRAYRNSLMDYDLENVRFVHDHKILFTKEFFVQNLIFFLYRVVRKMLEFNTRYKL